MGFKGLLIEQHERELNEIHNKLLLAKMALQEKDQRPEIALQHINDAIDQIERNK